MVAKHVSEVNFTLKSHILSERSLSFSYVLTSIILRIDQRFGSEIFQGRYRPIRGFMILVEKNDLDRLIGKQYGRQAFAMIPSVL